MDTKTEINALLEELAARCPMGYVVAAHIGYAAPRLLFQTYPLRWTETYSKEGLAPRDPVLGWGMRNAGSARWDDLGLRADDPVMAQAASHDLRFGMVHATALEGARSISAAARNDRNFSDFEIAILAALFDRIHIVTGAIQVGDPETEAILHAKSIELTRVATG